MCGKSLGMVGSYCCAHIIDDFLRAKNLRQPDLGDFAAMVLPEIISWIYIVYFMKTPVLDDHKAPICPSIFGDVYPLVN